MDCRLPTAACLPVVCPREGFRRQALRISSLLCSAESRGFGTEPTRKGKGSNAKIPKENVPVSSVPSKVASGALRTRTKKAPDISTNGDRRPDDRIFDRQFLEKVESVRRSALEQKKAEVDRIYQPIDYDTPMESEQSPVGMGTKVGVGLAVIVFGLVFAFGDFFPFGRDGTSSSNTVFEQNLSEEEKSNLEETLGQFEETLRKSPEDSAALEGSAVTLIELGEYGRASSLLEKLIKEMPENVDAYRLLGEVKYELKDYEASVAAYKSGLSTSKGINFEVLRGLTNALLAAKKPEEAVQVILSSREQLNDGKTIDLEYSTEKLNEADKKNQGIEPIQVELLLGKAYSDWGHVSDAVSVYNQLISKFPNDFRGYLAKGIILKEIGKTADAERMFIQARFFAPEKSKAFVDRYSRQ